MNEINLVQINLQTNCQTLEALLCRIQNIKTLKTVFNVVTSVKIFYTTLKHIPVTQNTSARKLFKYNGGTDGESMQELMTYLAQYLTGS